MTKLERLKKAHALTREYLYARALHGVVIDPQGKILFDSFQHFGTREYTVDFQLDVKDADIQGHCRSVTRHIANNLNGDIMTGVHALCSSEWFDRFIRHPRVKSAFDFHMVPGNPLHDDVSRGFLFQGILFEEYAARSMASDEGQARFFPTGTAESFDLIFAPADWLESVNTVGLDLYAAVEPMANRKKGVTIETQSNVLPLCLNPSILVAGV